MKENWKKTLDRLRMCNIDQTSLEREKIFFNVDRILHLQFDVDTYISPSDEIILVFL